MPPSAGIGLSGSPQRSFRYFSDIFTSDTGSLEMPDFAIASSGCIPAAIKVWNACALLWTFAVSLRTKWSSKSFIVMPETSFLSLRIFRMILSNCLFDFLNRSSVFRAKASA